MIPTENDIRSLADKIASLFHPRKIILFGSFAYGNPNECSDVDLLVIMPFKEKNFRKSLEILNEVKPRFMTDIIARRPEDTKMRYEAGDPLIREALDKGVVLYESGSV
jgi:predicted nucleotidyltransferase